MSAHVFLAATQMIGSVLRFTPSAEQTPKLIAPRMLALLVEVQILNHEFAHLSLETRCFTPQADWFPPFHRHCATPRSPVITKGFWALSEDLFIGGPAGWGASFSSLGRVRRPVHIREMNDAPIASWFETEDGLYAHKCAPLDPDIAAEARAIAQADRKTDR